MIILETNVNSNKLIFKKNKIKSKIISKIKRRGRRGTTYYHWFPTNNISKIKGGVVGVLRITIGFLQIILAK